MYSELKNSTVTRTTQGPPSVSFNRTAGTGSKTQDPGRSARIPLVNDPEVDHDEWPANADDTQDYVILDEGDLSEDKEEQKQRAENKSTTKAFVNTYVHGQLPRSPNNMIIWKFLSEHPPPGSLKNNEASSCVPGKAPVTEMSHGGHEMRSDPEHFIMSTPPRPQHLDDDLRSPPGLEIQEYPLLDSHVPTKHQENMRRIAAQKNMISVFGQELVIPQTRSITVSSSQTVGEEREPDRHLKDGEEHEQGRTVGGLVAPREPMASPAGGKARPRH